MRSTSTNNGAPHFAPLLASNISPHLEHTLPFSLQCVTLLPQPSSTTSWPYSLIAEAIDARMHDFLGHNVVDFEPDGRFDIEYRYSKY